MTPTVLVGTNKGAFVLRRDTEDGAGRGGGWSVSGPHCAGWTINHVIGDGTRLWAGGGGAWFGAGVWRSVDGGESWALAKLADGQMDEWARNDAGFAGFIGYTDAGPAPFGGDITAIWSLGLAGGRLLAGANPAALYASDDGGESWAEVTGLSRHPTRESWNPGAAGLVLHSILADPSDPARLWVGISAAGSSQPRMAVKAGSAATASRTRGRRATTITTTTQPRATGTRPGIACTTSCARRRARGR